MNELFLSFGKEIVVALLTAFGGLFVYLLKSFFNERKRKMLNAEKEIKFLKDKSDKKMEELKDLILATQHQIRLSHDVLKDMIYANEKLHIKDYGEMRGQVNVMSQALNSYSENVSKLAGRVDDQLDITASHIATISHMSKQLDRLFIIADAKKRASDVAETKDNKRA